MHAKRKSGERFKQVNQLCDEVVKCLPPIHALVLLQGWRHANAHGIFCRSTAQLAEACGISARRMRVVLGELESKGALKVMKEQQGTLAKTYFITGEPRSTPRRKLTPREEAKRRKMKRELVGMQTTPSEDA